MNYEARITRIDAKNSNTIRTERFETYREAYNFANEEALKAWYEGVVVISVVKDLINNVCYTNVIDIKGVEHK